MGSSDSRGRPKLLPELTGALPTAPDRPNVEKNRVRAGAHRGLFGGEKESITIGRYEVVRRLGEGAMGVVYGARDSQLDRVVAIKVLNPSFSSLEQDGLNERMLREARAMAQLSHPNVATIFDVGTHDGQVFLAMEHIGGGTLRDWLTATPHSWSTVLQMLMAAGSGLAAAHRRGLIHRDFKPDNVLLDSSGTPKIVDFGLVRHTDVVPVDEDDEGASIQSRPVERLTRTGALLGTPVYMPPEQLHGESIDARCDQFAFCATLFEALNGRRPFAGDDIDKLMTAVENGACCEMTAQVPEPIRAALLKGLSANREERFPTMDALLAELDRGRQTGQTRRRRVLPIFAALAVVLVFASIGAAAVIFWSISQGRRSNGNVVQVAGSLDLGVRDAGKNADSDSVTPPSGQKTVGLSKLELSPEDAAIFRRVKTLEAEGRYRECLDLGESVPGNVFLFGYRTSCALYLQDWDAYNRACRDWERLEPDFYDEALCSPRSIALHKHVNQREWRECNELAKTGPPSMRNLTYRISCSSMVDDWETNRRACELLAELSPNHTSLAACRTHARHWSSGEQ